jgi:nitrilase
MSEFRLAAIVAAPAFLDRKASTDKACTLIAEAGRMGATIAAFGETWLPGYPIYGATQIAGSRRGDINARYIDQAVEIPGPSTDQLCAAAADASVDVVIGIAERDAHTHSSVYCTLLFIGSGGTILGRHRKLKPTDAERMSWADGDASGLRVHERPYARISGLNCWEHNMVLPGYVLMAEGTQIHVASWPGLEPGSRQMVLSRAFASQAAAYVISVGTLLRPEDASEDMRDLIFPLGGDAAIIDPEGNVLESSAGEETILIATGTTEKTQEAGAIFDVGGHYSRPDIFQLTVDRRSRARVNTLEDPTDDESRRASGADGPSDLVGRVGFEPT